MKKIFYCLILTLTLSMLFSVAVFAEDAAVPEQMPQSLDVAEDEPSSVRGYIEGTVIPAVVAVISGVSALYIMTLPLIRGVKATLSKMSDAKKSFDAATAKVKSTDEEKAATEAELAALREDVAYIKAHIDNVEKIERIGFCHMKELVQNGRAREIGKVGKDENKV